MYVPLCGRFGPDEEGVAGYVDRIGAKYAAKWDVQMAGMNFQTGPSHRPHYCPHHLLHFHFLHSRPHHPQRHLHRFHDRCHLSGHLPGYLRFHAHRPGHLHPHAHRPGHPLLRAHRPGHLHLHAHHPGHPLLHAHRPGHLHLHVHHPGHPLLRAHHPGHPLLHRHHPAHLFHRVPRPRSSLLPPLTQPAQLQDGPAWKDDGRKQDGTQDGPLAYPAQRSGHPHLHPSYPLRHPLPLSPLASYLQTVSSVRYRYRLPSSVSTVCCPRLLSPSRFHLQPGTPCPRRVQPEAG
nr:DUF6783 domain-containing protein [Lachnoclostridium pacaense]